MSGQSIINRIAQIFIFLCAVIQVTNAGEHILRLQEGTHTGTTLIGVEQGSSVLIRCEHPNGKVASLRWLRGGSPIKSEYVKTKKDASFVEITNYLPDKDNGVYECSAPGMSASYRLKGEKKHILPEGFRYCYGEEMASCKHADQCLVETSTGHFSCLCEVGWTGAACDMISEPPVRVDSVVTPPVCAYWPPVVTLLVFIVIIVLLAYCLYKFKVRNPHHYSKYSTTTINNNNTISKPPMVSGEYTPVHQHPPGQRNGDTIANMV
ncbi:Ig-like domain-containing protein [Caenorhabditis elegans]|uniref:Ig-like domain-containing protein n=1 Tax=Caenorhabditis elegans TaxID=6239 RepID=Q20559_CAEEL|nr:Ig-like domain-containing protein [Caenorhabditis elegans]CAA92132.1 Ig-like domain-containing protein [Caenorhabditis elegans]|eukprot:NP_509915.1 IG (immunoglobulin), EGF and transmmembrane domain [Caenorhabditis elegans]